MQRGHSTATRLHLLASQKTKLKPKKREKKRAWAESDWFRVTDRSSRDAGNAIVAVGSTPTNNNESRLL